LKSGFVSRCMLSIHYVTESSSSMALQPAVGLGLHYNKFPNLSISCSISPFVYSHLSQVRRHVIQRKRWSLKQYPKVLHRLLRTLDTQPSYVTESSSSSSSMALQPGVGLGLHSNTSPNLSIPCSTSPFVYSRGSQTFLVRGTLFRLAKYSGTFLM
jgi:hypothetical protein